MLKQITSGKRANFTLKSKHKLCRSIKRISKKLKNVHTPERKDFQKNVDLQGKITDFKKKYYQIRDSEDFLPLSQAEHVEYSYPSVNIDGDKINEYIRNESGEKMAFSMEDTLWYELEREPLMSESAYA